MERLAIGDFFDRVALGAGERDALVSPDQGVHWRYREVHARTRQLAKGLMGLGVDPGDHVAVFSTNRVEWVLLKLAVAKVGAVLVPVDPRADAAELAHVLADAQASTLFLADTADGLSLADVFYECDPDARQRPAGRFSSRRFPVLKRIAALGTEAPAGGVLPWADVVAAGAGITDHLLRRRQEAVAPTDLATVQYTAGTTGDAKGVKLTHQSVVANAAAVGDCMRLGRADRLCVPVSFARPYGSVVGILTPLGRGATVIVPSEHFDAGRTLAAIAAERATAVLAEPRMLVSMLRHPDVLRADVSSLRTGLVTGGACPVGLVPEAIARLHLPELSVGYGLAETTAIVTQTRPDDAIDLRATTAGRALLDVEVKIVDPTSGVEVATGAEGELCCRGPSVMCGYYERPEATAAVLGANGWLRTGDRAVMDRFGNCTLTGRVPR